MARQKRPTKFAYVLGPRPKVLAIVLAGGEGKRLHPLTAHRAKPAVPFGGTYRIIDFVLSNFVNSGIHRIKVLTQYKSDSLNSHLSRGWRLSTILDHYVEVVPAQQRISKQWFQGSADAIHQSFNVVTDEDPDLVCVFGGDHIYRMDIRHMVGFHAEHDADLTVAAVPVPVGEAEGFGIIEVDAAHRMIGFQEKPTLPKEIPGRPGWCLASMGNYVFNVDVLHDALLRDAQQDSAHDFGRNILPMLYPSSRVYVYDFLQNAIPGMLDSERGYWKDVGTIESYWSASMDLVSATPAFNFYNPRWPIHSTIRSLPPTKFVVADPHREGLGTTVDSLISPGCVIEGGHIEYSILSPKVRVHHHTRIEQSVLMDGVTIGHDCLIRKAIIDKNVTIPPHTQIGVDFESDRRKFTVSDEGIVVIAKNYDFDSGHSVIETSSP